jgi:hypothetical protein
MKSNWRLKIIKLEIYERYKILMNIIFSFLTYYIYDVSGIMIPSELQTDIFVREKKMTDLLCNYLSCILLFGKNGIFVSLVLVIPNNLKTSKLVCVRGELA